MKFYEDCTKSEKLLLDVAGELTALSTLQDTLIKATANYSINFNADAYQAFVNEDLLDCLKYTTDKIQEISDKLSDEFNRLTE